MTTTIYNKLVRDKIPEIIVAEGHECTVRTLDLEEYRQQLMRKLIEEAKEATESFNEISLVEELSDVLEVIYALANSYGRSVQDLETVRIEKRLRRGGFDDRLFLQSTRTRE